MNRINLLIIITVLLVTLLNLSCNETTEKNSSEVKYSIFSKGQLAPAEFFTGNAWVTNLVDNDSVFTTATGSVYFEAGARSNWHSHPGGQILIVTDGVGYHQIKGEPVQIIRKGDVVKCSPDLVHWHGASKESSMTHIYIVPNTENGIVKWMKPVTDEEYSNLL
jgi:quercetin dioxygenase-like cupin family protein